MDVWGRLRISASGLATCTLAALGVTSWLVGCSAPLRGAALGRPDDRVTSDAGDLADPVGDRRAEDVRHRLDERESGTYIGEILAASDSAIARWPERVSDPVRVWIQPRSGVADWHRVFVRTAREAFTDWTRTGIPVRFTFVADSASAEARVVWADRFEEPISGTTRRARDGSYWITDGNIRIAVHRARGIPLDRFAMKAIALHEVGHLLGLDHTSDETSIMAPRVRARDLSGADRATIRLLYALPPGPAR